MHILRGLAFIRLVVLFFAHFRAVTVSVTSVSSQLTHERICPFSHVVYVDGLRPTVDFEAAHFELVITILDRRIAVALTAHLPLEKLFLSRANDPISAAEKLSDSIEQRSRPDDLWRLRRRPAYSRGSRPELLVQEVICHLIAIPPSSSG